MLRKDKRGISLVEILVVIAIIGVVATVGIWGLNAVSSRPAQQCSQKLIYSLERNRVTVMGKSDAYYKVWINDKDRVIFEEGVSNTAADDHGNYTYSVTSSEIGNSRVKLSYLTSGGEVAMGRGDSLTIRYDRGSGAFKSFTDQDGNSLVVTGLVAQSGGKRFVVRLVQVTGKVYLD